MIVVVLKSGPEIRILQGAEMTYERLNQTTAATWVLKSADGKSIGRFQWAEVAGWYSATP